MNFKTWVLSLKRLCRTCPAIILKGAELCQWSCLVGIQGLYLEPLHQEGNMFSTKAIFKMIVMGSKLDGASSKEAATAHAEAIEGMDSRRAVAGRL